MLQGVAYQPHRREASLAGLAGIAFWRVASSEWRVVHHCAAHPYSQFAIAHQRKTPGSCLPGVLLSVSSLSGSEVTLSANVQEHSALVLVLVERGRLGRRTCQDASTRELLVRALQRCRLTSRSVYLPTAVSCSACTRMWNTLSPRRLTWVSPQ